MDNFLPLTALLLKGQSDCEIPAAKIWPPTRTPVRDCIRPYFSERPKVREYESDAKIRPDRRLLSLTITNFRKTKDGVDKTIDNAHTQAQ